jgi:RecG-like helicase
MNAISRAYRKFTATTAQLESEELRDQFGASGGLGTQQISQCRPGTQIEVVGTVRSVSIQPSIKTPALEVELYDGSGVVTVIWLGRRTIPGIVAGRTMKVCGRLTCNTERPVIFNPKYELRPLSR